MCTLDVLTVTGAKKLDWHTMCINNRTRFRDGDLPEEPCVGVRCVTGRQCINGADGLGVGRAVRVGKKPCTAWVSIPAWGVTPAQFKCARVTSCVTVPVYGITHRACGLNNSVDGDQKRAGVLRGPLDHAKQTIAHSGSRTQRGGSLTTESKSARVTGCVSVLCLGTLPAAQYTTITYTDQQLRGVCGCARISNVMMR